MHVTVKCHPILALRKEGETFQKKLQDLEEGTINLFRQVCIKNEEGISALQHFRKQLGKIHPTPLWGAGGYDIRSEE
jgi:hypothetical protein